MSGKNSKNNLNEVTSVGQGEIKETLDWLDNNSSEIPENTQKIIKACLHIVDKVTSLIESNKLLRKTLGAIFGGESKSEKASSDKPKNSADAAQTNTKDNENKHEGRYHGKSSSNKKNKRKNKIRKNKCKKSSQNSLNDVNLPLESSYFPLNNSQHIEGNQGKNVKIDEHFSNMDKPYLRSEYNERTIVNIKFIVETTKLNVETVTDTRTGRRVTAEVEEAPPYSEVVPLWWTV